MADKELDHSQDSGNPEVITADPKNPHTTFQGEPNGLPPAAPEVQLEPPEEVKALREWQHTYIKNSIHSRDTDHYNDLHRMAEAMIAKIHTKYPLEKDPANDTQES